MSGVGMFISACDRWYLHQRSSISRAPVQNHCVWFKYGDIWRDLHVFTHNAKRWDITACEGQRKYISDLRTAVKIDMTKLQQQPYQYNVIYSISHLFNNIFRRARYEVKCQRPPLELSLCLGWKAQNIYVLKEHTSLCFIVFESWKEKSSKFWTEEASWKGVKRLRVKTPYFYVKQQTELTNVLINFPMKISKGHKLTYSEP